MQALYQCDLTVIVPVYNLEKHIVPLLFTLINHDLRDYKVQYIFVMNNCTDDSEKVIRESGIQCEIYQCERQGCGSARNVGLDHARGKYLWFMDGDDWLLSETAIADVLDRIKGYDIIRVPFISEKFKWQYFSMVWQYVIRHEFVKEFRFPDYQPAEDDAYMNDVLHKAGYSMHNFLSLPSMEEPLYYYNYMREGSNMYRVALGERI